jgi:16S rRNA U516 pseudouridylate synthase RsuA-like enzyme
VASRRDAERLLAEGRVKLNNAVVTHPATFVDAGDLVVVNGKLVDAPARTRLWRFHKPVGLVTTHKDPQDRPTVFQKLPPSLPRVVSVGRNREVRRVMAHLGLEVSRLIRVAYGPFQLGNLAKGEVAEVPTKVLREQIPAS